MSTPQDNTGAEATELDGTQEVTATDVVTLAIAHGVKAGDILETAGN